jgi:hypothetical protein
MMTTAATTTYEEKEDDMPIAHGTQLLKAKNFCDRSQLTTAAKVKKAEAVIIFMCI